MFYETMTLTTFRYFVCRGSSNVDDLLYRKHQTLFPREAASAFPHPRRSLVPENFPKTWWFSARIRQW